MPNPANVKALVLDTFTIVRVRDMDNAVAGLKPQKDVSGPDLLICAQKQVLLRDCLPAR